MTYQDFLIIIGVFILLGLLFYQKLIKGTNVEGVIKKLLKKAKKTKLSKSESEVLEIVNLIGNKYEIISYTVTKKIIKLTLKRKEK